MPEKIETRDRARREILHYVLSFCSSKIIGDGDPETEYPRTYGGLTGWISTSFSDRAAQIGDLILLESAPASKWIIGWLVENREQNPGWPEYLIESIEDGEQCWWGNVGISYMQRRVVQMHPHWRWTDSQFLLWDRWRKAYKRCDGYVVRVNLPEFHADGSVTVSTRMALGLGGEGYSHTFPDWRKVTLKALIEVYRQAVAARQPA